LLERVRAVVGAELPIGITLDPHANVTRRMCALAQCFKSVSRENRQFAERKQRPRIQLWCDAMNADAPARCTRLNRKTKSVRTFVLRQWCRVQVDDLYARPIFVQLVQEFGR
ncbi:hypothetical protein EBR21_17780, partial [bacterium]|nr:hypothetical protein [bacterium]